MADLDFSDILVDPDLASVFSVIRRVETVDPATGMASRTSTQVDGIVGVVTPGDPGHILRKDDSTSTSNLITVSTSYRLRPSSDGVAPDIVLFDGVQYTVKAVKRWNRILGSGFVKVVAESGNASDPSPV